MKIRYNLSVMSPDGEVIVSGLNSRGVYRYLGVDYSPDGYKLDCFNKNKPVKVNGHWIIESGKEQIVMDKLASIKEKEITKLRENLRLGVGNVVFKLNTDLSLIGIYTGGLEKIAKDHFTSVGTIKSKLHRDKKYITKTLYEGKPLDTKSRYRLIYLNDLRDIWK